MNSLVILISGRGSNLKALLDASLPVECITVISNNPDAPGLGLAEQYSVKTDVVDHRDFTAREEFDIALAEKIDCYQPDLIALAGFMRILSDPFVQRYQGKMLNIHPSLLPAYSGLKTHARALQDGVKIHGCTVHFVTSQLDYGPIVIQAAVSVLSDDTEQTLADRVLQQEHRIFPQAVRWFMMNQLELTANSVATKNNNHTEIVLYSPTLSE